jgi:hypothetical protein
MKNKFYPAKIIAPALTVILSVLIIYGIVQAGSLTPSAAPASTMHSLQEMWDVITGDNNSSGVAADAGGNIMERLTFIQQNLGGYTYGSSRASNVLTVAGGTYNASLLIPSNVRSGVAFATSSVGTFGGGGGWTYGSDEANEVLTIADSAGTYNASNLFASTTKTGVSFGVGLTGAYPSASYPLSGDTGATDALAGTICNANEAWTKTGSLLTGTLSVNAAYTATGTSYCGVSGTLLGNLFNGTGQGFTGGVKASGGVDDNNNGGASAASRYEKGWTQCDAGNSYCGTGDSGADARDDSTGLVWSKPCNGSGCGSFSDASPADYSWDNSGGNNNSRTANQLCSDHSGWYLPHQKQLMMAYIDGSYGNLETAGVDRDYWSATTRSYDTTYAWRTNLSNGTTYNGAKTYTFNVRCVR